MKNAEDGCKDAAMKVMSGRAKPFIFVEAIYYALLTATMAIVGVQLYLTFPISGLISAAFSENVTVQLGVIEVGRRIQNIYVIGFISFVVSGIISFFRMNMLMRLGKHEKPRLSLAFASTENTLPALKLSLLRSLYVYLWALLLIVPGVIKAISYSMAELILAENPDLSAKEALARSEELMRDRKEDYFMLYFSFLLWKLGKLIFSPIGFYGDPYYASAKLCYYNKIKNGEANDDENR